jgi:hypothetical protein
MQAKKPDQKTDLLKNDRWSVFLFIRNRPVSVSVFHWALPGADYVAPGKKKRNPMLESNIIITRLLTDRIVDRRDPEYDHILRIGSGLHSNFKFARIDGNDDPRP